MQQVVLILFPEAHLTAVTSTIALLESANELLKASGREVEFKVRSIGIESMQIKMQGGVQFSCDATIKDTSSADIVIIPPVHTGLDLREALSPQYQQLVHWIKAQNNNTTTFITLCSGVVFLAATGLLNDYPATAHWGDIVQLQRAFPLVRFESDKVFTSKGKFITGGGGFSALQAMLFFIEQQCGKEIAILLSKYFALEYGRFSQQVFTIFTGFRQHGDEAILHAQNFMEATITEQVSVEQVAAAVHMSRRNFIRRFKQATTKTPIDYIQHLKVELAKKAIEKGENSIAALCCLAGYNDIKSFRATFKRITGLTPVDYRKQYADLKYSIQDA